MEIPVVILGANFYTALGAIRTLGRRGVPVYALDYHFPSAYALSSRYVSEKVCCPDINLDEKGLASYLVNFSERFDQQPVLMATADSYALMMSRHAETLAPLYRFAAMKPGLLEKIIDKKGLCQLAQEHNLPMPATYMVTENSDTKAVAGEAPYPCIVKPALSHKFVRVFRQKALVAHNRNELLETLNRACQEGLEVMVQEIIPGFDDCMYVFDVYIDSKGRATHTFTGQKLRQFPINFGSSTLTHQVYDRELVDLGLDCMDRLGYRGYGEIEFKKHPQTGRYYLIEINARLSTLNILFDRCGVEFAYISYRDLIGDPLPAYHLEEELPWAFWHAYEDAISCAAYLRSGQLTLKKIIKPWLAHRKAHAIWAADDPLPLFSFARLIAGKAFGKIGRLLGMGRKTKGRGH